MEKQMMEVITPDELLNNALRLKNDGYRLVAISCSGKEEFELSYSFDKDYVLYTLRLNISADTELESVSSMYSYAFLYENEIKELFGVNFRNMTLDFGGNLYTTAVQTPFGAAKSE